MNFDHVLQPPLNHNWYHGWYHLALHTTGWECDDEVFEITLDAPYYPFLQELSLIRPLRILSPESFFNGPTTDPITHNSCPEKWGHVNGDGGMASVGVDASVTVNCVGVRSFAGTGPWVYDSTTTRTDGSIQEVVFSRNAAWWGQHGGVEELRVVNYNTSELIKQALIDGSLDVAVGDKVLTPQQVQEFQNDHSETHATIMGPRLFNQIVVMNAAKAPTDDIEVRRLIMHSVDKAAIVQKEMYGQAAVADSLFPRDAPYCDIDLTPRWDYDFEKATLMNCPDILVSDEDEVDEGLVLGLSLGIGLPVLAGIAGAVCFFAGRKVGYKEFSEENDQRVRAGPPAVVGVAEEGHNAA